MLYLSNRCAASRTTFMPAQSCRPVLMSRNVTGWEGGADRRDQARDTASMQMHRPKKATPVDSPY